MIRKEGYVDCTITDAYICDCKFPAEPNEVNRRGEPVVTYYDLVIVVTEDSTGDTGIWKGEISNRSGFGNKADFYRSDLTLETLQKIGFYVSTIVQLEEQFVDNADGSAGVPNLQGIKVSASVEKREWQGKEYYDVKYLNAPGSGAKKLSMSEIRAKRAASAAPAVPAPPKPGCPY